MADIAMPEPGLGAPSAPVFARTTAQVVRQRLPERACFVQITGRVCDSYET